MDISISGVPKAGDWKSAAPLQVPRKVNEIDESPAGNNDVFI
jgi:hypothetical protein